MENPYAQPAASKENPYSNVAPPATPEEQLAADYEAAIGPNTGYYLPRFADFDTGRSLAGWNWPAFFATSGWFLYRKMWLPGILNLAWPVLVVILAVIVAATVRTESSLILGLLALLLVLPSFLLPVYANALYWRRIHRLIADLPAGIAAHPQKRLGRLEREGGTAPGATAGVLIGSFFFGTFFLGVFAAIAIPAYQDYTIRSQVIEGLNLASQVKLRVEEYRKANGAWPEQADLGSEGLTGKYVMSINVAAGSVVITYGNAANSRLTHQRLILSPGVMPDGDVAWACGYGQLPDAAQSADGPYGSTVAPKYLPVACRGGGTGRQSVQ